MDRVKSGAEQAAAKTREGAQEVQAKAREGVQEVQAKRDLAQAYDELGKLTFELVERSELSHAQLDELVGRIRGLQSQLAHGPSDAGP
jgi:hypothetical protein